MKNKITLLLIVLQLSLLSKNTTPPDSITYNYLCSDNTFLTLNSNSEIQVWQLNNNVVTGGTIIANNTPGNSLSYCGNSVNQTFYSGGVGFISYYNSPNWVVDTVSNFYCGNSGGYKNYQYFLNGSSIYYYNGSNLSFLFNANFQIADLVVDSIGRAWAVTTDFSNNAFLKVIDSTGTILSTYADSSVISLTNAYGMFLMNDTIYVGFGGSNPSYPNKILPIIINGTEFHFGTPISFPGTPYYFRDFASCSANKNVITNIRKHLETNSLKIYPIPTTDIINVDYPNFKIIEVYNSYGDKLKSCSQLKTLSIGEFNPGIYYLKIVLEDKIVFEKVILNK